MSRYQVDKLLHDIRRDRALAENFRSNIEAVLDHYQLEPVERELLKSWKIRDLYDRGANPLLLLLAHSCVGGSMRDYAVMMNPKSQRGGEWPWHRS
jgi:hypothetical protein